MILCLPKRGFKKRNLFLFETKQFMIFEKSKSSIDLDYLVMRLILLPNLDKDAPVNENANIWIAHPSLTIWLCRCSLYSCFIRIIFDHTNIWTSQTFQDVSVYDNVNI